MESSPCPRRWPLACVTVEAYSFGSPFGSRARTTMMPIWRLPGAPGRIRTRDPLLRRQLLYPAELQAPTDDCAGFRSRRGLVPDTVVIKVRAGAGLRGPLRPEGMTGVSRREAA